MWTTTKILGPLGLVFVFAFSVVANPKPDVKTKAAVTGEVVTADIADNTLLLKSHGKDVKFSVPGRISMLNLKPGDQVSLHYLAEGKQLRVWQMERD